MQGQKIVAASLKQFLEIDMGPPLHSFVICAEELHPIEDEMYKHFSIENSTNK
jgi:diphthine methyl ester synthase